MTRSLRFSSDTRWSSASTAVTSVVYASHVLEGMQDIINHAEWGERDSQRNRCVEPVFTNLLIVRHSGPVADACAGRGGGGGGGQKV
jgi:hypothetical protein